MGIPSIKDFTTANSQLEFQNALGQLLQEASIMKLDVSSLQAAQAAAGLIYQTIELGLAGTPIGQFFAVMHLSGDSADVFLNNSGTAELTGTMPYGNASVIQSVINSELAIQSYPITPLISIHAIDCYKTDGSYIPNRSASTAEADGNKAVRSSPEIDDLTINKYAGPSGLMSAKLLPILSLYSVFYIANGDLHPGGVLTYQAKIKLNTAGSSLIKFGKNGAETTGIVVTDAAWVTVTWSDAMPVPRGTPITVWIKPDVFTGYYELLIDEVQVYSGAIPAYVSEKPTGHARASLIATGGSLLRNGNFLKTSNNVFMQAPAYPLQSYFAEITVFISVKPKSHGELLANGVATAFCVDTKQNIGEGINTLALGIVEKETAAGRGIGAVAFSAPASLYNDITCNNGFAIDLRDSQFYILGVRVKADEFSAFCDDIEYHREVLANPGLKTNLFQLGSGGQGSWPIDGDIDSVEIFDSWLNDNQASAVVAAMKQRLALRGGAINQFNNLLIAEGDSLTVQMGVSNLAIQLPFQFSPFLKTKTIAVSGSRLSDISLRQSETISLIKSVVASGRRPILNLLVGANDSPRWGSTTPATVQQYKDDLVAYWQAVKSAGATLVASTITPINDPLLFTARDSFNIWLRAQSASYDALADYAANAIIGHNAAAADVLYYVDGTHLTNLGYQIMLDSVLIPAVESVRLPE